MTHLLLALILVVPFSALFWGMSLRRTPLARPSRSARFRPSIPCRASCPSRT